MQVIFEAILIGADSSKPKFPLEFLFLFVGSIRSVLLWLLLSPLVHIVLVVLKELDITLRNRSILLQRITVLPWMECSTWTNLSIFINTLCCCLTLEIWLVCFTCVESSSFMYILERELRNSFQLQIWSSFVCIFITWNFTAHTCV